MRSKRSHDKYAPIPTNSKYGTEQRKSYTHKPSKPAVWEPKPSYAEGKHKAIQAEVDEVYRKAEAFDDIEERFDSYKTGVKEDYEKDMTGTNLHLLLVGAAVKNHFDEFYVESGESE